MRVVKIDCYDCKTWANAWIDGEDLPKVEIPDGVVFGAVIKEDDNAIYVTQACFGDEYRNIFGVPKGAVVKITELKDG